MSFVQVVVQWLHVLGGIFWFGGTLYALFILAPVMMSLPAQTSGTVFGATAKRTAVLFETVGGITILLGIVRGTLLGPVRSLDFLLGTPYGITWGIALLLGLGILAWSHFIVAPSTDRVASAMAAGDTAEMRRGMPLVLVELAGFFGIFTCMILMRFGL
jgi:uncharacterized membrane protein